MSRYDHIIRMESILDTHQSLLDWLEPLLEAFEKHQEEYRQLIAYYDSPQFLADYEASNSSSFPKEIKCGVLSEDAVFNLLGDNRRIAERMLAIGTKILKEE